jgi:flagellar hook assembly protein FlgD
MNMKRIKITLWLMGLLLAQYGFADQVTIHNSLESAVEVSVEATNISEYSDYTQVVRMRLEGNERDTLELPRGKYTIVVTDWNTENELIRQPFTCDVLDIVKNEDGAVAVKCQD